MKLSDIVQQIFIDPRKLTHYALDWESPHGKHKAILFEKLLGFTKENYDGLISQIQNKALHAEAFFHSEDQFGKRYTVDVEIEGIIENKQATVRTGWLVPDRSNKAHLVTLYVIRR